MKTPVILRNAEIADIPAIIELYTQSVLAVCVNDYTSQQLEVWAKLGSNQQRWQQRIATQYFIVAEIPGSITGFASLDPENYLDVFYVSRDYQRQGIANQLFDALLEKALNNPNMMITADVSKTARPFFERNGFHMIQENINMLEGVEIVNYRMEKI